MTKFEILAIVISCVAALISLHSWNGQRRLQRENNKLQSESNDLQRATSELAKKQLELLQKSTVENARLRLDLEKSGNGYKFYITNFSDVDAFDVDMRLLVHDPNSSPLITSEVNEKLPARKLSPGSRVSLRATLYMGGPTAFNAILKWKNPDGTKVSDETYASI